ncbi:MAG: hypothetical protein P8104_12765, partial [Gammaproteobacteria bacterium]
MSLLNNAPVGSFQSYARNTASKNGVDRLDAIKLSDKGEFAGKLSGVTKLVVPLSEASQTLIRLSGVSKDMLVVSLSKASQTLIRLGGVSKDKAIVLPKLADGDGAVATLRIRDLGNGCFNVKVKRATADNFETANLKVNQNSGRQVFSGVAKKGVSPTQNQRA